MRKLFIILCFLISGSGYSAIIVDLAFHNSQIKQGSLEKAVIRMEPDSAQKLNLHDLRGLNVAETLFFYNLAPLVKSQGKDVYESEVEVIVLKKPEEKSLKHEIEGKDLIIKWGEFQFIPTETPKDLLYGSFEIPRARDLSFWMGLTFIVLIIIGLTWQLLHRRKRKIQSKKVRQEVRDKLLQVNDYFDVVQVWKDKHDILNMFPQVREPFIKFEKILFQHQFKPFQTEAEKDEVVSAYKEFISDIRESLNGI